jgi:hypothetical protein
MATQLQHATITLVVSIRLSVRPSDRTVQGDSHRTDFRDVS